MGPQGHLVCQEEAAEEAAVAAAKAPVAVGYSRDAVVAAVGLAVAAVVVGVAVAETDAELAAPVVAVEDLEHCQPCWLAATENEFVAGFDPGVVTYVVAACLTSYQLIQQKEMCFY